MQITPTTVSSPRMVGPLSQSELDEEEDASQVAASGGFNIYMVPLMIGVQNYWTEDTHSLLLGTSGPETGFPSQVFGVFGASV